MRKIFTLLIVAILATATSWAATTGTITFGTNNVKITKASMTAADDQGNSWKITTVGTTSFTQQPTYSQVGSGSKPATSITFTTTLPKEVKVTSMLQNLEDLAVRQVISNFLSETQKLAQEN